MNENDTPQAPRSSETATPGTGAALKLLFGALWRDLRGIAARLRGPAARASEGARGLSTRTSAGAGALFARTRASLAAARQRRIERRDAVRATASSETSAVPRRPRRGWRLRPLRMIGLALVGFVVALSLAGALAISGMPGLDEVGRSVEARVVFQDAEGQPLLTRGAVPSDFATLDQIPDTLEKAVISIEDHTFYQHHGLNYGAILRAAWTNLTAGEIVAGGSTISQQLVKISYLDPQRTFRRKIHEALLTRELERRMTKDEILERYLNAVYLGSGATGMPAAAHVYFDASLDELTLPQMAALAAMIRAPSVVNPFADLPALRARAALVIAAMRREGYLTSEEATAGLAGVDTLEPKRPKASYGSWFADWVVQQSESLATDFDGVTTLRTTLDPRIQQQAEQAIAMVLGDAGSNAQAALVALDPDGRVRAMVGGRDYGASQFNRAVDAMRQPGSTFKTFVYLTALEQGYQAQSLLSDRALDIDGYSPQNFDGQFHGDVTLQQAFVHSLNAASVGLAMDVGIDKVIDTARTLGIEADLTPTPSLALGASAVSLIDMTEAYASLATGRMPIEARGLDGIVVPDSGEVFTLRQGKAERGPEPLLAARPAMIRLLANVVQEGTGHNAAIPQGAAGKTGTSQDYRDALFIGWNKDLITGVWVGNDDNSPMDGVTGGSLPAKVFAAFMGQATGPGSAAEALAAESPDSDGARQVTEQAPVSGPVTSGPAAQGTVTAEPAPQVVTTPQGGNSSLVADLDRLRQALQQTLTGRKTCDIEACRRAYRSFRASDCSYQPYTGPRQRCTR